MFCEFMVCDDLFGFWMLLRYIEVYCMVFCVNYKY